MLGQRPAVALEPVARGVGPGLAVDMRDAAVAGADQVQGRHVAAEELARHHRGERVVLHEAVEQHRRGAVERRHRPDMPGEDGAVDQPDQRLAHQLGDQRLLELGVAVADAGGDGQPVRPRLLAHRVELERAPGVGGDLVGEKADHGRADPVGLRPAPAAQGIAELARRLAHPRPGRGRKPRAEAVVQHQRHRGLRHPRRRRDIHHGRALAGASGGGVGFPCAFRPDALGLARSRRAPRAARLPPLRLLRYYHH